MYDDEPTPYCSTDKCKAFQAKADKNVLFAYAAFTGCRFSPNPDDVDICYEAYNRVQKDTGGKAGSLENVYRWYQPLQVADASPMKASELRAWAQSQGYQYLRTQGGIEMWGYPGENGWRVKLKLPSLNAPDSNFPRYSVRVEPGGDYLDPVTGETDTRAEMGHGPLEWDVDFGHVDDQE